MALGALGRVGAIRACKASSVIEITARLLATPGVPATISVGETPGPVRLTAGPELSLPSPQPESTKPEQNAIGNHGDLAISQPFAMGSDR
jgi:hypothetical protein